MATDKPYSLDFFNKITNVQFGGAWVRIRVDNMGNPPPIGPDGAGYTIDFPGEAGGTPGYVLGFHTAASETQSFFPPPRSVGAPDRANAKELGTVQKTKGGLGLTAFTHLFNGTVGLTNPPFNSSRVDAPDAAALWINTGLVSENFQIRMGSNWASIGPGSYVADISFFKLGVISGGVDLFTVKPTNLIQIPFAAPPLFPTQTISVNKKTGVMSVS